MWRPTKYLIDNTRIAKLEGPKLVLVFKVSWLDISQCRVPLYYDNLQCAYDLEGSKMYSLKWYKDKREIFR